MSAIKTRTGSGFTIVEMLLSLFIMGMLLAAVAVAFNASVVNYNNNRDMYLTVNSARQALLRITTDLRSAIVTASASEPSNQCNMVTSDDTNITYLYDSTENKLYMVVNNGANAGSYLLCDNVTDMSFERSYPASNPSAVKDVQILMTVTANNVSKTIAAAAVVRKNL